uniref:Putative secreted protein n=1 Tax=Xenopsylla cheopis TaxID=163159 RepID=A0A6M2DYC6_XENCH
MLQFAVAALLIADVAVCSCNFADCSSSVLKAVAAVCRFQIQSYNMNGMARDLEPEKNERNKRIKKFKCDFCNKVFGVKSVFKRHLLGRKILFSNTYWGGI